MHTVKYAYAKRLMDANIYKHTYTQRDAHMRSCAHKETHAYVLHTHLQAHTHTHKHIHEHSTSAQRSPKSEFSSGEEW